MAKFIQLTLKCEGGLSDVLLLNVDHIESIFQQIDGPDVEIHTRYPNVWHVDEKLDQIMGMLKSIDMLTFSPLGTADAK